MTNAYSIKDILGFLTYAGERGLMPVATASALAVATRNVFSVLEENEQENIAALDLDAVINRFNNKRAQDFNPKSLKEYESRVRRAVKLYEEWKANPSGFTVKTRNTRKPKLETPIENAKNQANFFEDPQTSSGPETFTTSCPIGQGRVITLSNVPVDLTSKEAEKLAQFVSMLAVK
jgi:hypothetical protein